MKKRDYEKEKDREETPVAEREKEEVEQTHVKKLKKKKKKNPEKESERGETFVAELEEEEISVNEKRKKKKKKKTEVDEHELTTESVVRPTGPSSGRGYTVSIALPGSIVDNAQTLEMKTYLAGQVTNLFVSELAVISHTIVFDPLLL